MGRLWQHGFQWQEEAALRDEAKAKKGLAGQGCCPCGAQDRVHPQPGMPCAPGRLQRVADRGWKDGGQYHLTTSPGPGGQGGRAQGELAWTVQDQEVTRIQYFQFSNQNCPGQPRLLSHEVGGTRASPLLDELLSTKKSGLCPGAPV